MELRSDTEKERDIELLIRRLSPEKRRELFNTLFKVEKSQKCKEKVKVFREVTVAIHCIHCGTISRSTIQLEPRAKVSVVSEDGRGVTVEIFNDCKLDSHTDYCDSCRDYVRSAPREDLEKMYLELLQANCVGRKKLRELYGDHI